MATATDVVLLQDLTGSYWDDLPALQQQIPIAVNRLTNPNLEAIFGPDIKFGISSFKDKPVFPLGESNDYVYQSELALTTDISAVKSVVDSFKVSGGFDWPEAQLEALMHTAFDSDGGLGYRSGAKRIALIATDADYHIAGDYSTAPANDYDSVIEDEDYPTIPGLKSVLETEEIEPVFLATPGVETYYEDLVDQLGRGYVVTLQEDSSNVADAIKFAVAKSNLGDDPNFQEGTTSSEALNGAGGDDVIFGLDGNDSLYGYGGDDFLDGGFDLDYLYGGSGSDTVSGGDGGDYLEGNDGPDTLIGGSGDDTLLAGFGNDVLQGDDGDDLLDGGFNFSDSDIYVFDTGAEYGVLGLGVDTISIFKPNDKIQLSQDTFTAIDPSDFFAEAPNLSVAETLSQAIVNVGGDLYYNENGTAPGLGSGGQFASISFILGALNSGSFEIVDV